MDKNVTDGRFNDIFKSISTKNKNMDNTNKSKNISQLLRMAYPTNKSNRGRVLILNQINFQDEGLRSGSAQDCNQLKRTFIKFGFEVTVYLDTTLRQYKNIVENEKMRDNSDMNCFIFIIMTHGSLNDSLSLYDHKKNLPDMVTDFTNCKSLDGIPKLFFVQACRGEEVDDGNRVQVDSVNVVPTIKSLNIIDTLIVQSTFEGYYSWRHPKEGSWFIQELCIALNEHIKSDILTILTFVNRKVSLEYESQNHLDQQMYKKKQTCVITSTLTRPLFL